MSDKRRSKKATEISDRKVWIITVFCLIIFLSCGFFFYKFMQDYSYKTYLADAKNCYELQEYECAIIHTNEAEEFNPLGSDLLELKADLFFYYYKNLDKAISHYSLALNTSKKKEIRAAILFKRAKVYRLEGRFDLCKEDLLLASESNIDSVNLYLANIYNYRDHNYPLAIQFYLKGENQLQESFVLNFGLAFAYYNNREYDLAISIFNKCIIFMPTSGESFYFRGLSYNSINQQNKACQDYQKALELDYSIAGVNYQAFCH